MLTISAIHCDSLLKQQGVVGPKLFSGQGEQVICKVGYLVDPDNIRRRLSQRNCVTQAWAGWIISALPSMFLLVTSARNLWSTIWACQSGSF
jgi:uncharacterized membrane protein